MQIRVVVVVVVVADDDVIKSSTFGDGPLKVNGRFGEHVCVFVVGSNPSKKLARSRRQENPFVPFLRPRLS
jgi:hypothetical protein